MRGKMIGKKVLVYVITFMMVFSTMPGNVWEAIAFTSQDAVDLTTDEQKNEFQIGDHYEVRQSDGTTGSVKINKGDSTFVDDSDYDSDNDNDDWRIWVDKTIDKTGTENLFNVTLTVKTKDSVEDIVQPVDSAVTLVIDASSSMRNSFEGYDNRFDAAITAASEFVRDYSEIANGKRMISIVYFFQDSVLSLGWTNLRTDGDELNTANVNAAITKIEEIPTIRVELT